MEARQDVRVMEDNDERHIMMIIGTVIIVSRIHAQDFYRFHAADLAKTMFLNDLEIAVR